MTPPESEPRDLGFSEERMLAGEKSAEEGGARPLAEVMQELRRDDWRPSFLSATLRSFQPGRGKS